MRLYISVLYLFVALLNAYGQESNTLEWEFYHPRKKEWISYGTHGSIQEKLIESRELPDPFYGKNAELFNWIEEHTWKLRCSFNWSKTEEYIYVELYLPAVDTYGEVLLNGKKILKTQNAFIPYSAQLKEYLRDGKNELQIILTPPVMQWEDDYKKERYHLPAPSDENEIKISSRVRKPQYQFGWDWAPRMNTIGLNKPASIHRYNDLRILNKSTVTKELADGYAVIESTIFFTGKKSGVISWKSERFGTKNIKLTCNKASRLDTLWNPKLWWPIRWGDQYLYNDKWIFKSSENQFIESAVLKYGVKSTELVRESDGWGTSYYFKVNGKRIFAKGSNYVPQSIFPASVTESQVRNAVLEMEKSNFNMIRVWGGGYYPDEVFYNTCDSLGILVWQDFMFACAMYPSDFYFVHNVSEELDYQVPRIASHPCIAQFNGNNEVDVAWKNWGFEEQYHLDSLASSEIEAGYEKLFKQVIPGKVKEYCSLPYTHTSPLSNWGKAEDFNNGSQHYWGVWHGQDDIDSFKRKIGRFNTEYGFQSFPGFTALHLMADTADWSLDSDLIKYHQKSYVGNQKIEEHALKLYGKTFSFEKFVYFSQLTQAEAMRIAITSHRLDQKRCGGTLYWQFNDVWPAPTWSGIDFTGEWKAAQYEIRDCMRDITLVYEINEKDWPQFYLVYDHPDTINYSLKCTAYDHNGKQMALQDLFGSIDGDTLIELELPDLSKRKLKRSVLVYELTDDYNLRQELTYTFSSYSKFQSNGMDFSIISVDTLKNEGLLEITTQEFHEKTWIYSIIPGVRLENNFLDLLPGKHIIRFTYEIKPKAEDFQFLSK